MKYPLASGRSPIATGAGRISNTIARWHSRLTFSVAVAGLAIGTSVAFVGTANAQEVLRVGAAPFAGPVTFMDPGTETFGGYMVDLVSEIAADNGFEVEFVPLLVQDLGPALTAGDIDVIAGIILDYPPTREAFLLSRHVYEFGEGLFVRADDPGTYATPENLAGARVAMQVGTYQMIEDLGLFEVVRLESILDVLAAVDAGEVDAGITGGPTGAYQLFLGNYPNVRRAEQYQPTVVLPGVIAVRIEETDLMNLINATIERLGADGTLADIFARYGAVYVPMN